MAKKKIKKTEQKKTNSVNYELKTDAVDRLVNADKKKYDNLTLDPTREYRHGILDRIPSFVKALFIKFWFNGAVCYFILWGLGMYVTNTLDMLVILSIVMGMVTDLLVNNTFHFFAITPGDNNKWMMFPQRKFWTFFANIIYCGVVLFIVFWIYNAINIMINSINGTTQEVSLGVEPLLFGIFFLIVDLAFIGVRNLFRTIIADAKEKTVK